jgi:uncharacterized protein (TIGR00255 family)
MTGFGAANVSESDIVVRVEARSVNHRHLQVKARLPHDQAHLEPEIESAVKSHLERGAVTISVSLERASGSAPARIDAAVARRYKAEIESVAHDLGLDADVSIETLLALPGVIATHEDDTQRARESKLVQKCVVLALKELVVMREREGKSLLADLEKNAAGVS